MGYTEFPLATDTILAPAGMMRTGQNNVDSALVDLYDKGAGAAKLISLEDPATLTSVKPSDAGEYYQFTANGTLNIGTLTAVVAIGDILRCNVDGSAVDEVANWQVIKQSPTGFGGTPVVAGVDKLIGYTTDAALTSLPHPALEGEYFQFNVDGV